MSYEYVIINEGRTEKWISSVTLGMASKTIEELEETFRSELQASLAEKIMEGFFEQGYNVVVREIREITVWHELRPIPPGYKGEYRLWYCYKIQIFSDKPFSESPVAEWVFTIIKIILGTIVGGIVGYFVLKDVIDWWKSMTTTTTTIKTHKPDCTWTEETRTEPSFFGMSITGIFLLIGFMIVLLWFFGRPKK